MDRRRTLAILMILGLTGGLSACENAVPGEGSPSFQTRDSANVVIVENSRPAGDQPWLIEETPTFSIGGASVDPAYQLWRVGGAVRLADGTIVIANRGTSELRWYSDTGEFIRSAGRQGQGPGEFEALSGMFLIAGDSVAATDVIQRRLSIFDAAGEFVRSVPLRDVGFALPIARFRDGAYLLTSAALALGARGPTRVEREIMSVYRFREGDQAAQSVASLPWLEMVIGPTGGVSRDGSVPIGRNRRAFGRETWVTADSLGWIVGDNERPELQVRSPAGEVTRIVRWSGQQREVTADDLERGLEWGLSLLEDPAVRRRVRAAQEERPPPPETMPAFGRGPRPRNGTTGPVLLLDAERNVWVKEYSPPAEEDANRFLVFDSTGVWLGFVTAPSGLSVLSIGSDYLIGVSVDEVGVETVSLHHLVKRG